MPAFSLMSVSSRKSRMESMVRWLVRIVHLMLHQPEARGRIRKGRAEDRHILLVGDLDERIRLLGVAFGEPAAHLADELARAVGFRRQFVGDGADRRVAGLKLLLVDEGVVDAVDVKLAHRLVVHERAAAIMLEAERLEEIHVHNGGAGRDNGVHHVVADQIRIKLHAAARRCGTGQRQHDGAAFVSQHPVEDLRCAAEVARRERHGAHGLNDRARVERRNIDVLDFLLQQVGLEGGCLFHFRGLH